MEQGIMEKQIMWAVYGPDGKVCLWDLSGLRKDAVQKFEDWTGAKWKEAKTYGWKVKKVSVTIEPIKPKP